MPMPPLHLKRSCAKCKSISIKQIENHIGKINQAQKQIQLLAECLEILESQIGYLMVKNTE